jgi:phage terminase small subunit
MGKHNENGFKKLTGKQAAFVDAYLGAARFNASQAARLAGYKATSKHSFDSIGSENLTRPAIRTAIDEYWKMSRMSADEVLKELGELARGDGKEKIRALALLSQYHGLLDGAGRTLSHDPREIVVKDERQLNAEIEAAITQIYSDAEADVRRFNEAAEKNNQRIENAWQELLERFKDSPAAIEALTLLHAAVHEKTVGDMANEPDQKPIEPEIIPPDRRLRPAAVERLMSETEERSPTPITIRNEPSNAAGVHLTRFGQRVEGADLEHMRKHGRRIF